jgi:hypothetical protein
MLFLQTSSLSKKKVSAGLNPEDTQPINPHKSPMKSALLRQAGLRSKKGQSILEIVIYMVILGVIALAGSIGYSVYLTDANGSACNTQLNQLDVADKSYCATYNITPLNGALPTYVAGDPATTEVQAFLGGRIINGAAANAGSEANITCPAGGVYAPPAGFAATNDPDYPKCSLGVAGGAFAGTRFHSIDIVAAAGG